MTSSSLPDLKNSTDVRNLVAAAVAEDLGGTGDVTTSSLVPKDAVGKAVIIAKESTTVSGTGVAELVFKHVDNSLAVTILVHDGELADPDSVIMAIEGASASILVAERTALNFMQRMCGIAQHTALFVRETAGSRTQILDTRKTTPGLRLLEKYAVLCGGGANHRFGLFDRVLIKDNHRKLWGGGGLGDAVKAARTAYPDLEIEIEVETLDELRDALSGAPDWVLLDNMPPDLMTECVRLVDGRSKLEASGGITIADVKQVASTGVDAVSLGCLTHTFRSADLSLEFV